MAHRNLVRALLTEPISTDELSEARQVAETMVRLWDDSTVSMLYAEVLVQQINLEVTTPDFLQSAVSFISSFPERRLSAARRLLNHIIDIGDDSLLRAFVWGLFENVQNSEYVFLSFEMFLKIGDLEAAASLLDLAEQSELVEPNGLDLLRVDLHTAKGSTDDAQDILSAIPPTRPNGYSERYVSLLSSQGRSADVLTYLDSTLHSLSQEREACIRFDQFWNLGKAGEAEDSLLSVVNVAEPSAAVCSRLLILAEINAEAKEKLAEINQNLRVSVRNGASRPDDLLSFLFDMDDVEEVRKLASDRHIKWRMGPIGRYTAARAAYVQRDFDEALRLIETLRTTVRHWHAAKLRGRILLELGHPTEAISDRESSKQINEPFDEVIFFSQLQLGEIETAFKSYLGDRDFERLDSTFTSLAEKQVSDLVDHRFVISMNGPGDEIQTASLLSSAQLRSNQLTVTCDPRLESLLVRSFPSITFVPVSRTPSRPTLGSLTPAQGERSRSVLFDVLDEPAHNIAKEADRVVFSRSLAPLSVTESENFPSAPYLSADRDLKEKFAGKLYGRKTCGLVWRSEFSDAMRSIHYLEVSDFNRFFPDDVTVVCLQHDVTDEERSALKTGHAGEVLFFDDVDLRNDFEGSAALISVLDHVVGVGTTVVELAGAVGTRTVLLQPNLQGSWRRGAAGNDYWHSSVDVAVVDDVHLKASCLSEARQFLWP